MNSPLTHSCPSHVSVPLVHSSVGFHYTTGNLSPIIQYKVRARYTVKINNAAGFVDLMHLHTRLLREAAPLPRKEIAHSALRSLTYLCTIMIRLKSDYKINTHNLKQQVIFGGWLAKIFSREFEKRCRSQSQLLKARTTENHSTHSLIGKKRRKDSSLAKKKKIII